MGYLPKNVDSEELILAIKTTSKGLNYFPLSINKLIVNHSEIIARSIQKNKVDEILLSVREKEVLDLVLKGESSKKIGENLFLSVHTVNTYKKSLFKKFQVNNVASLIVKSFNNS